MNMVGVQGFAAYIHVFVYDVTCIETCILTHCLAYIWNVMFCVVWGSLRLFMQLFVSLPLQFSSLPWSWRRVHPPLLVLMIYVNGRTKMIWFNIPWLSKVNHDLGCLKYPQIPIYFPSVSVIFICVKENQGQKGEIVWYLSWCGVLLIFVTWCYYVDVKTLRHKIRKAEGPPRRWGSNGSDYQAVDLETQDGRSAGGQWNHGKSANVIKCPN